MDKTKFVSDFRIVMIGKNQDDKAKLGTFLTAKSVIPYGKLSKQSNIFLGQWNSGSVSVLTSSNLYKATDSEVEDEITKLVSQSSPGPNALLLLVDPSDFTRTDKDKLKSILARFGEDANKYSMVIVTSDAGYSATLSKLKQEFSQRYFTLNFNELSTSILQDLMAKIQTVASETQALYQSFSEESDEPIYQEPSFEPPLNIVLSGLYSDWKATAAGAILGQKINTINTTRSIEHTGAVNGRLVTVIELPTLSNTQQDAARQESLHCLSLCEPEGLHALVLVQPVGPLNPEDKQELEILQRVFTSRINAFKIILFTVDSDSVALAVANFIKTNKDVGELCESCCDRYIIFNVNNRVQVREVLKMVDQVSANGAKSFNRKMTIQPRVKRKPRTQPITPNPGKETLRIVLIGKTGSGKSATANTILGRDEFTSKLSQTSVTRFCTRAEGQVEERPVVIVDTPGLFDTTLSNEEVQEELMKCVSLLAPGPHVFLLVLQIGRFTKEEQETVQLIKEFFGNTAENYMIIVFTRGDDLENTTLEAYLAEADSQAEELLETCGNRYHVLNNRAKQNRKQVHELLSKIDATVEQNNGGYYTSDIFQEAEVAIEKETERILQEKEPEIQKQKQDIEEKHKEEVKNQKSKIAELKAKIEKEIIFRARELHEKQVRLAKEQENRRKYEEQREQEERAQKEEEIIQIEQWNQRYINLERQINNQKDSVSVRNSLILMKEEMKREHMAWEHERQEWWERRLQGEKKLRKEENQRLAVLEKEYAEAKREYEIKKREDEATRQIEEREWRSIQETYQRQLEELKRINEEQAREQGRVLNDFLKTYAQDQKELEQMRERRQSTDEYMLRYLIRRKVHNKDFNTIKLRHQKELEELEQLQKGFGEEFLSNEISELQKQHNEEIHEFIQDRVKKAPDSSCAIL